MAGGHLVAEQQPTEGAERSPAGDTELLALTQESGDGLVGAVRHPSGTAVPQSLHHLRAVGRAARR
uniref:Uncharacterized protein n=1 Tax=Janibacter limosus TaxID=53458 RepID=A0AC61U579_9MICO|nr:hypothetical protein [Janibacter limosus]